MFIVRNIMHKYTLSLRMFFFNIFKYLLTAYVENVPLTLNAGSSYKLEDKCYINTENCVKICNELQCIFQNKKGREKYNSR